MSSTSNSGQRDRYILWIVFWTMNLLLIFEGEIRSIGLIEPVPPINLIAGFWLSDLGLLFPILIAVPSAVSNYFLKGHLVKFFIVSCFYSLILFFLYRNSFIGLGNDIRICMAFFTGLSLICLLPKDYKTILTLINITSSAIVLIITLHLLALPEFNLIDNDRITSSSAFVLIGIPLTFIAPNVLLSLFSRNRFNLTIAWITLLTLIAISAIILKTRSLFIAEMVALMAVLIAAGYSVRYLKHANSSKNLVRYFLILNILVLISLTPIIFGQISNIDVFKQRFFGMDEDFNSLWRQMEAYSVYQTMSWTDFIFGMGFNPPSPLLTAEKGESYNSLHIGILNLWWRFGLFVFMWAIFLYVKLFYDWINSLRSLKRIKYRIGIDRQKIAIVSCAPGIFTILSISLLSGGWGVSISLPLGMLLGLYYLIIHDKNSFI